MKNKKTSSAQANRKQSATPARRYIESSIWGPGVAAAQSKTGQKAGAKRPPPSRIKPREFKDLVWPPEKT